MANATDTTTKENTMSTDIRYVTIETPVGTRTIPEGSPWWKGNGRGHTRDFIEVEKTMVCRSCNQRLAEDSFPTFTIPRKDGRTRSNECRECRDVRKAATAKKAKAKAARANRAAKAKAPTTNGLASLLP
jgi:hypothetical protein